MTNTLTRPHTHAADPHSGAPSQMQRQTSAVSPNGGSKLSRGPRPEEAARGGPLTRLSKAAAFKGGHLCTGPSGGAQSGKKDTHFLLVSPHPGEKEERRKKESLSRHRAQSLKVAAAGSLVTNPRDVFMALPGQAPTPATSQPAPEIATGGFLPTAVRCSKVVLSVPCNC